MDKVKKYLVHCAGFYALLSWVEQQRDAGMPCMLNAQTIHVHPLVSRGFSLGVAGKGKHAKELFLAIQPSEAHWFSMIAWKHICLRKNDNNIYFVSETVPGDNDNYPDQVSFALALPVDIGDKATLLQGLKLLAGREYHQDETGQVQVNMHKKIFSLPLVYLDAGEAYMTHEQALSYSDLMLQKEKQLELTFSTAPEFKGDINMAPGTEGLFKKYKDKEL